MDKNIEKKSEFSEKIFNEIKKNKIKPIPAWFFVFKKCLVFALFVVSIFIGALATGVTVFLIKNNDWDLFRYIENSFLRFTFQTLPYLWFVIFAFFLIVAYFNFRYTKKGYRYSFIVVSLGCLFLSVSLGYVFYKSGIAQNLEGLLLNKVPVYNKMILKKHRMWHKPEKGLLVGNIKRVVNLNEFQLNDFDNKIWFVRTSVLKKRFPKVIEKGRTIKVIGTKINNYKFKAFKIRRLRPPRRLIFPGIFLRRCKIICD